MGNGQSKKKQSKRRQEHPASIPASINPSLMRRASSPGLSTTSYSPPAAPPPPYITRATPTPIPNGRHTAETQPPRMPSPERSLRRAQSDAIHDPRRSQPPASSTRVRMPTVSSMIEEAPPMPMPMPVPHPAQPTTHVPYPVSPVSPARAEPPHRRKSKEDPLTMLRKYDTVIIVDDSGSMAGALWNEAREALSGIATIAGTYDTDGIDIYFLNSPIVGPNLQNATDVKWLFGSVRPQGITPTGAKLEELLLGYLSKLEQTLVDPTAPKVKPISYIIITDGAPTDDPESVIMTAARRLDKNNFPLSQVGIQFVQIGTDPEATEALRQLDDELSGKHDVRDMVDTTPYSGQQLTAETLTKILLGGINRRVDRRGRV